MIAGAGAVWAIWQFAYLYFFESGLILDPLTINFGIVTGLILVLANILLLECLTHLDISLGATIYRLNTIGVVILSFLLLGEELGPYKLMAIGLGVFSVLLLYNPSTSVSSKNIYLLFLGLIILASLLRASYGVVAKLAINQGASIQGMIPFIALCWVFGGLIYASLKEKRIRLTGKKLVYMTISGTLIFLTVATLMQAISLGEVSTLIPIANCSFIIALILSAILKLERVTLHKIVAVLIAACSIIMLSRL